MTWRALSISPWRLGTENVNGEPFVTYKLDLTGANEEAKNSEVGLT